MVGGVRVAPPRRLDRLGRLAAVAYAIVSLLFAAWFLASVLGSGARPIEHSDYMSYHAAGDLVLAGEGGCIYDPACQERAQRNLMPPDVDFTRGLPFNNPPSLALLLAPLAALPLAAGFAIWNAIGTAAFIVAAATTVRHVPGHVLVVLLALTAWPTVTAILRGQVSLLVSALLLGCVILVGERSRSSGALLGLATLKPTLVPLLGVWLLWRRAWAVAGVAIITGVALLAIPALVLGPETLLDYPGYAVSQLSDPNAAGIHPEQMINWRAAAIWTGLPGAAVLAATLLTLVAVAAIWLRAGSDSVLRSAAALLATPLVIPHANQHEALLGVVAWLLLVAGPGQRVGWLAPTAVAMHIALWLALPLWGDGAARLTMALLLVSLGIVGWLAWRQPQDGNSTNGAGHGSASAGTASALAG